MFRLCLVLTILCGTCLGDAGELTGDWTGRLTCPGGDIEFGVVFEATDAFLVNGPERIQVAEFQFDGQELVLGFPHYDSVIRATLTDGKFHGSWAKTRGEGQRPELPFTLTAGAPPQAKALGPFEGRWRVRFSSDDQDAVGIITETKGVPWATFLTATGDYRFLSARVTGDTLWLSVFDGAHAFLFRAKQEDGRLNGDFWSGDHWHETWQATRDDEATIADGWGTAESVPVANFDQLRFRNLQGERTPLDRADLQGKVIVFELFGSWCPNCHDAAEWLAELDAEYADDELSIVGLAFELTGDVDRDVSQVNRYIERFEVKYPVYIAGLADKKVASAQFPLLDRVRAYPTTMFMDASGKILAVYHGFSGPATGEAYEELKAKFRETINQALQS
ncbi:MAG: TlpA disulfide reductase family protein [Planctomycetota bacterium]